MEGKKKFNINDLMDKKKQSNFSDNFSFTSNTTTNTKDKEDSINPLNNKPFSKKYYEILKKRKTLPAYEAKAEIIKLVLENQTLVLQGETGSGKTTQVPQFLIETLHVSRYDIFLN